MTSDELLDWVAEHNGEALLADGFDAALLGVAEHCGQPSLVVYDAEKCIEILIERDGMSREDAAEFFHFNTLGAWAGQNTPLFLWRAPLYTGAKTAEIQAAAPTPSPRTRE